ncbi:binding-protein-dependent transport systems inner membrane component [Petrotoga mobilis SJ95]|uniref:Binding-protein-dependent transport systems inner membrane component n=1 Tax=Petrotoga mobilis (strain DSM 10674 / SJ95) TaxID=403833 RepID=A9BIY3_PETMO|nr:ABC transporter permease [Petrotoga mobilis]ABX32471.1 binding-protein-dependent transport systems inner membrane component [Petrotoga mobilis SJ95]
MSLRNYIIVRILLAIPMLFVLLVVIFFVIRIIPGDPVAAMLGGRASQEVIEARRAELGLNDPILVQFFKYVGGLFKGDLGTSTMTGRPVLDEILERFPATLELTIFAFIVAVVIGVFWGSKAAQKRDKPVDIIARGFSMLMYAVPVFWFGLMMQFIFGMQLKWLPIAGRIGATVQFEEITGLFLLDSLLRGNWTAFWDVLQHLLLPGITLGLVISSIFLRMVRNNTILTLTSDYVKSAKARGIPENRILYRHALRNALVPILTVMGLQLALLMAGAVLTETTFSWPGIGSYLIMKIRYRDFPAIQGTIVFFAIFVIIINIIVEIINALIDPRVRY